MNLDDCGNVICTMALCLLVMYFEKKLACYLPIQKTRLFTK